MSGEASPLLREGIEKFAKPWYRARRVFLGNSVLAKEVAWWLENRDRRADSPRIPETEWRQYLPGIPCDPPCA